MSKNCGHLSEEVTAASRENIRVVDSQRWSRTSAPTIANPIYENFGKPLNPTPFNLGMEEARKR